ncbi:ribbon-helix-helix domain-containing protein [Paenibacillus senegalimassiliensis]|uniref:hypothetical protein n=1 Tax=Paenibacillus senegalimassiliensis TaxID=1737426 RepID=UPI000AF9B17A|nr:hypothetical protein [Paenibacillus senegalimassiliensis]
MPIDKRKHTQILVTFEHETVREIEAYWHDNKIKSRTEAIRELVKLGLLKSKDNDHA